jgi:hypothetical protein
MILFFIEVFLLQGLFTINLTTKGLRTEFVIAGISLLKGSLLRGFNVVENQEQNCNQARALLE